jgi:hypothetical protein
MKKILGVGACLLALAASPVLAQTGQADVVVVKVKEYSAYMEFGIARAGRKPEYRLFKPAALRELGDGKEIGGTAEATRQLLIELAQQGYSLTTTYSDGNDAGRTTLVFTKKQ